MRQKRRERRRREKEGKKREREEKQRVELVSNRGVKLGFISTAVLNQVSGRNRLTTMQAHFWLKILLQRFFKKFTTCKEFWYLKKKKFKLILKLRYKITIFFGFLILLNI